MVDVADAIKPYLDRRSYDAASMDDRVQVAAHAWIAARGGELNEIKSRMLIKIAAPFIMFYLEPEQDNQHDAEQVNEMRRQINQLCWYETFKPSPGSTPKVWDRTYAPGRASNRARSGSTALMDAAHAGDWHRAALAAVRAVDRQHQQPLILAIMIDAQQAATSVAGLLGDLCARLLVEAIGTSRKDAA